MKKRLLSMLVSLTMLFALAIPCMITPAAAAYSPAIFQGSSWYGRYTGWKTNASNHVERYMNMTISTCDANGNITGKAYVTTVPGQDDTSWVNYEFRGTIDLKTGAFTMQGTKELSSNSGSNWNFAKFTGTYASSNITGICDGSTDRPFSFGLVSGWAKDEVTEADSLGLIPDTLYGKDLSKPITRAEFCAVALQLYENLTETEVPYAASPFTDIAGDPDAGSIARAASLDITVGTTPTTFSPSLKISREQLATMLTRTVKKYLYPSWTFETDSFYPVDISGVKLYSDDKDISDYARESVYYLTKLGVVKGTDEKLGTFSPKAVTAAQQAAGYATATREQALLIAVRLHNSAGNF
ncbi:MAG: S-layer homology domain-containing protein [Evtepia sp.]